MQFRSKKLWFNFANESLQSFVSSLRGFLSFNEFLSIISMTFECENFCYDTGWYVSEAALLPNFSCVRFPYADLFIYFYKKIFTQLTA